jgi:hypothetical protein
MVGRDRPYIRIPGRSRLVAAPFHLLDINFGLAPCHAIADFFGDLSVASSGRFKSANWAKMDLSNSTPGSDQAAPQATGVQIMLARAVLCFLVLACVFSRANALTQEELVAKLESAGYSQVRENGSGKIKTFRAVKNGKEVSVIIDSRGQFKELQ